MSKTQRTQTSLWQIKNIDRSQTSFWPIDRWIQISVKTGIYKAGNVHRKVMIPIPFQTNDEESLIRWKYRHISSLRSREIMRFKIRHLMVTIFYFCSNLQNDSLSGSFSHFLCFSFTPRNRIKINYFKFLILCNSCAILSMTYSNLISLNTYQSDH